MNKFPHSQSPLSSKELYLRLLGYVRPYWKAFVVAIICMGLSSAAEPAFPAFMKYLLDDGFSQAKDSQGWLIYPIAILVIFIFRAIVGIIGDYAMSWVAQNVILSIREEMFSHLLKLPITFYNNNLSGVISSKITNDVAGVASACTIALTSFIKDSLSIFGLLCWLLYLNWQLTLISLALIPFIALVVKYFSKRMRSISRGMQESFGKISQVVLEAIEGVKVIKIYSGQPYERRRFSEVIFAYRHFCMKSSIASATQGPFVQFFSALALAIIVGIGLLQASEDQNSVGSFVSFITAMLMTLAPTRRLTDINTQIQRGLAAAESVFSLIDQPQEPDNGTQTLTCAAALVEYKGVSFCYPGKETNALSNISFRIEPGECVAFVGASGSGKSTLATLLPRLNDSQSGEILVNNKNIRSIKLKSLRENISLVSQEIVLFNDTIAANIAYGAEETAPMEKIVAAAKAANALEFIDRLPDGMNTIIGEHGVMLSGGQKQRIAIARALLKNAPILILDEATSALDTESERLIQDALDKLMAGKTTIIIAHRLSTIERANCIYVLQDGEIVESGSHPDLLAKGNHYYRLQNLQKMASQS